MSSRLMPANLFICILLEPFVFSCCLWSVNRQQEEPGILDVRNYFVLPEFLFFVFVFWVLVTEGFSE